MDLELHVGYFAQSLISGLSDGAATLKNAMWMEHNS